MRYILIFLLMVALCFVQEDSWPSNPEREDDKTHVAQMKVPPKERFTHNWVFVIDRSSSLWNEGMKRGTMKALRNGWRLALSHPTDELYFSIYKFHDKDSEEYLPWMKASPDEIIRAEKWLLPNPDDPSEGGGLYSYGLGAIKKALGQERQQLTIIIITDGGFTSACNGGGFGKIQKAIEDGQKWRVVNGFGQAIICTIGIENKDYFGGGKPDDEICQAYLEKVGSEWGGGYWYVRKKREKVS